MENVINLAVPALIALLLIRTMVVPIKYVFRVGLHGLGGLVCLWILNSVSGFTGILLPYNAVTVLAAGFLGIPGIGLITLLEMI